MILCTKNVSFKKDNTNIWIQLSPGKFYPFTFIYYDVVYIRIILQGIKFIPASRNTHIFHTFTVRLDRSGAVIT